MTWQDELRALDANVAAGKISAEEYRRIRDDVLAKSAMESAASGPNPQQSAPRPGMPGTPPPGFPQPGTPPPGFPQPGTPQGFGAPGAPGAPQSPESTQYLPPVTGNPNPGEKTQVVPAGDAERTQIVSSGQWRPSAGGGQQPWPAQGQPPAQGAPGGDSAPPWGQSDFEPIKSGPEAWLRQGPEAFDSKSGGRGKTIGIVIASVLVVAVAVAAVLYFVNRGNGPTQQQAQQQTSSAATTTTKPLPAPPAAKAAPVDTQHALIDPPGVVRSGGGPLDLATLGNDNLLPGPMVTALTQAGMTDGLLKTTTDNGVTIGLYAFTVRSQADASTVAHAYASVQTGGGVPGDQQHSMQGVPVFSVPPGPTTSVFRAVYVLYNRVIIVETFGSGYNTVEQTFSQVLHQQVNLAPPTIRTP